MQPFGLVSNLTGDFGSGIFFSKSSLVLSKLYIAGDGERIIYSNNKQLLPLIVSAADFESLFCLPHL